MVVSKNTLKESEENFAAFSDYPVHEDHKFLLTFAMKCLQHDTFYALLLPERLFY